MATRDEVIQEQIMEDAITVLAVAWPVQYLNPAARNSENYSRRQILLLVAECRAVLFCQPYEDLTYQEKILNGHAFIRSFLQIARHHDTYLLQYASHSKQVRAELYLHLRSRQRCPRACVL